VVYPARLSAATIVGGRAWNEASGRWDMRGEIEGPGHAGRLACH
jgi:hypothetical protein